MFVVDTNVVSELMSASPAPSVVAWLDECDPSDQYLTSVSVAELLYGVGRLPAGRRRDRIAAAVDGVIGEDFRGRILSFDLPAAVAYARIVSGRRIAGRPIGTADAQIAAICASRDAVGVTRNVDDFTGCGIDVVDPWSG